MTHALRGAGRAASIAVAAALLDGALVLVLTHKSVKDAVLLALLPLLAVVFAWLVESDGTPLFVAGLGLGMSWSRLTSPLPLGGGHLYPSDVIVLLALGAWVYSRALRPERRGRIRWPSTPVLSLPLALFAIFTIFALIKGHERYGQTLYGQPTRLFVYAGIGAAVGGLDARKVHRIATPVFYAGSTWMLLNAVYYVATGRSQTNQVDLSTGGERVLAISASIYCAGGLFLALLNLRLTRDARRRLLHLAVAAIGFVGMLLGFGRAVIFATAVVLVLYLIASSRVRRPLFAVLPLALPAIVLSIVLAVVGVPQVERAIVSRVTSPVRNDANVVWREKANEAVLQQVRESPLLGVGFGRRTSFYLYDRSGTGFPVPVQVWIDQDPHDGYLMLFAAGGVLLLGSFVLLLVVYFVDAARRLAGTQDPIERIVVIWAASLAFVFLFNAASGTEFESGTDLLSIWMLLLIPGVVAKPARRLATRTRLAPAGL